MIINKVIFVTTDGYSVSYGDTYHIIDSEGIQHWICDKEDPIPTCDTYKEYMNAQDVKGRKSGSFTPNRWTHINIIEESINNDN